MKITEFQRRVVEEYLKDLNQTQAYIRAGGSSAYPDKAASLLFAKQEVKVYRGKLKREREKRTAIDADFVLDRLAEMLDADPLEIMDDTTRSFKPLSEWPLIWRRMLSAWDIKEILDCDGTKIGDLVKIKFIDKLKTLELLGKHVDIAAFADRLNVHVTDDLAERISAARKRKEDGRTISVH